jgi:hypothetical protein
MNRFKALSFEPSTLGSRQGKKLLPALKLRRASKPQTFTCREARFRGFHFSVTFKEEKI